MRNVGDTRSLVCESDRSWSAALFGGESLFRRGGEGILGHRSHNVGKMLVGSGFYIMMVCMYKCCQVASVAV